MSEPTPLSTEELAWLSNSETFRDPDARWDTAWLRSALATIDAQATEIAALKEALEAKEREMLAEHSSAMQALLRWCAEDTPEDIRKGWEQESHEALRALAAGRPR